LSFVAACSGETRLQPNPITAPSPPESQAVKLPGADQGGKALSATLTGDEEVPGPGDADGTGTAVITVHYGQTQICYALTASNIEPATLAHIHEGLRGVEGPIVVNLRPPTSGSSSGCVIAEPDLIKEIKRRPEEYYVNVQNAQFSSGAIRGQLGSK
jgi:hypothetical protein